MGKHSKGRKVLGRRAQDGPPTRKPRVPSARPKRDAAPRAVRTKTTSGNGRSLDDQLSPAVRKQRRRRRALRFALAALALIGTFFIAAGVMAWTWMNSVDQELQSTVVPKHIFEKKLTKAEPKKPFTMLLLGADMRHGETSWRADSILLAKVDPQTKKVWIISIPRDTRVDIPNHGTDKINAAHAIGGPPLLIETVEDLTDTKINHYLEVDFAGFKSIVNRLGGVWIDVDVEIDDKKAASHNPDRRAYHIDPGYQKLDGEHALTYVRSRNFPDGDFTRMRHQQEFFKAVAKQAAKPVNLIKMPSIVKQFAGRLTTDMSVGDLVSVATSMRGVEGDAIQTATLLGEWRSPYIWLDEEEKARLLTALHEGRSFDETATPDPAVASLDPKTVSVDVRNGAGVSGLASRAADKLRAEGYQVDEVGTAKRSDYPETLVVYKVNSGAAKAIAASLPASEVLPSEGRYAYEGEILVVVGKDWQ